ncbi:hypothetical protein FOL47_004937 [Perkinsus chesapeaki]|uniref:Uncharacterized protein n=1 Tax=Perkinsus chesapeaki TaxID=330153 RepID=A0A7J6LZW9_PERCH|nr:hypothetical protein FOL47_004937 [Perkinsus chesapeaki]
MPRVLCLDPPVSKSEWYHRYRTRRLRTSYDDMTACPPQVLERRNLVERYHFHQLGMSRHHSVPSGLDWPSIRAKVESMPIRLQPTYFGCIQPASSHPKLHELSLTTKGRPSKLSGGRNVVIEQDENKLSGKNTPSEGIVSRRLPKHINYIKKLYVGSSSAVDQLDRILGAPQSSRSSHGVTTVDGVANSSIKTVENAIAFFGAVGSDTNVKFMYLNHKPTESPNQFNPYDLVVTSPDKLDRTYYTISCSGIVRFNPGEPSEHMSLSAWMKESMRFRILQSMSVFKHFTERKIINRWRANARRSRFRNVRSRLAPRLLLVQERFAAPLTKIKSLIEDLGGVQIFSIDTDNCHDLGTFMSYQQTVREGSSAVRKKRPDESKNGGCDTSPGFGGGAVRELENRMDEIAYCIYSTFTATATDASDRRFECDKLKVEEAWWASSRGLALERARQKERELGRDLAMKAVRMLPCFLRLAHTLCHSALTELAVGSVHCFLNGLLKYPKLLSVAVSFVDSGTHSSASLRPTVVMAPSLDEFHQGFEKLLHETLSVISQPYDSFVLYNRNRVRKFLKASGERDDNEEDARTVEEAVLNDRRFILASSAIFDKLAKDFAEAAQLAEQQFVEYRRIYEYGQAWNEEEFIAKMKATNEEGKSVDAAALQREMALMTEFSYKIDRLKPVQTVGVLSVEGRAIKQLLTPIPQRGLSTMKELLLALLRERCSAACLRYESFNHELDQRPTKLEQFIGYVSMVAGLKKTDLSELEVDRSLVEELQMVAKQYKIKLSVDDTVALENLVVLSDDCMNKKLVAACEFTKSKKRAMIEEMHNFVEGLEESAKNMASNLLDADGEFMLIGENGWSSADEIPTLEKLCTEAEKVWTEILLWSRQLATWRDQRVDVCDVAAMKQAAMERSKVATSVLEGSNGSLISRGPSVSAGSRLTEGHRLLYEALVWYKRNCSVIEKVQRLSVRQWETVIQQSGLPLPSTLSNITISQLEEYDVFASELVKECIDSVAACTS